MMVAGVAFGSKYFFVCGIPHRRVKIHSTVKIIR